VKPSSLVTLPLGQVSLGREERPTEIAAYSLVL